MCGRFTITIALGWQERFHIQENTPPIPPRFNVAPSQVVPVIIRESSNKLVMMQWGLIPSWAKDPKVGYHMINARGDTLQDRPAYRIPFQKSRCIVPATGFYEWKKEKGRKIPYYLHRKDNALFSFAGLYDHWRSQDGRDDRLTFTIITTDPNILSQTLHDRMPAILRRKHEDLWLQPDIPTKDELKQILTPYPSDLMEAYPVSTAVNSPDNDAEDLIKPLTHL